MGTQQHNILINVSETGLTQVQSAMNNFASTSGTVVKSQDALATSMGKTQGAAFKTGQEFTKVDQAEGKTVKTTGSLGQAFKNSALQITSFVAGLISTVMQVNSVLAAENKLDKQRELLNKRTLALETAELKYNQGIANGTLTGEKARLAAEKLVSMRNLQEISAERVTISERAHSAELAQLALQVIPTVISTAAGLTQVYGTVKGAIDAASVSTAEGAESMDALGTAADTATTTGLIPTGKSILQMIPGIDKLKNLIGIGKGDNLTGALTNNGVAVKEHTKLNSVFSRGFSDLGSAVKGFASRIKTDMASTTGIIDKIKTGFSSFFTSIGSGFASFGGALKAAGSAIVAFGRTMLTAIVANPLLLAIGLIATAIAALIFDFGGLRTALNNAGIALGKMVPFIKPVLDAFGWLGQKLGELGDYLTGSQTEMEKTAQSSKMLALAYDPQIVALQKLLDLGKDYNNLQALTSIFNEIRLAVDNLSTATQKHSTVFIEASNNAIKVWTTNTSKFKNLTGEQQKIISEVTQILHAYKDGHIELEPAQAAVNSRIDLLNKSLGESVKQTTQSVIATQKAEEADIGLSAAALNVVNAMNATGEEAEEAAQSLTEQEAAMVKLLAKYGIAVPAVDNMTKSQKTLLNEIANHLPLFEKYGTLIISNADNTIDWDATVKAVAGSHTDLEKKSTEAWIRIRDYLDQGVEGYKLASEYVNILAVDDKEAGELAQKYLSSRIELVNENQKALSDFIDTAIVGGAKQTDVEKKVQESTEKTAETIQIKAEKLKIWDDILNLSTADQQNAIKITENANKEDNKSRMILQDLAVARGLDLSAIGQQSGALLEHIKNSELEANTIADVDAALGQIVAKRQDEAKAADLQTKVQTALLTEMERVPPLLGMTAKGLETLVKTYQDTANAQQIATDNVGLWWAELEKSQTVERAELETLETFADAIGVEIPNAIMAKGIPAVKAYIESVIGIGEGARKAREEALAAFDDLHNKAQSALSGVISDSLGEDGDEIKKALKGIEKTGVSILALDAKSAIIDIFLNDSDYTNKIQTLDEIYAKEFGEISNLSNEQGTIVGDIFIQSAIDALGAKGSVVGQNMEAIWNEIKASSSPTESGNIIIGKLKAALERKDIILAAMQQGVKDPVARVMALTDTEAQALAKNIPANLASVLTGGKGAVGTAAKTGLKDPVTQNVTLIPNEAQTALAPVEGIFSESFLKASAAAVGQLNSMITVLHNSMSFLQEGIALRLNEILSAWNDHATNVGTAAENINTHVLTVQQTISDLSLNVKTYMDSLTANINNMMITTTKGFTDYVKVIQAVQKAFNDLTLAVKSNMTSMTTYIGNWAKDSDTAFKKVQTSGSTLQSAMTGLNNVWNTIMDAMGKKVGSFASACETAFGKVKSSADTATKAVQALQKAIDALKDKTVTITYKIETKGTPPKNARFGGSSIGYARGGDSWIQSTPGRVGNMNVGEFGKPEMITVTPLSNPYDVKDKSINLGGSGGGGGGSGSPIIVTGNIHMVVQTQSGETLAKEIKPFLLSGFSGIT